MWPFRRKTAPVLVPSVAVAIRNAYQLLAEAEADRWVTISLRDVMRWHLNLGESVKLASADDQYAKAIQQIGVSALAAAAFRNAGWVTLPGHDGFYVAALHAEREGDLQVAGDICGEALKQGWDGDWQRQLDRLRRIQAFNSTSLKE